MQVLKAATLIAAAAAFALTATAPAFADAGDTVSTGTERLAQVDNGTSKLRWAAISAEGQRFHDRRHRQSGDADTPGTAKSRDFMAMAMDARKSR